MQAPDSNLKIGDMVFVPGADCYSGSVKSLFGGAAQMIISSPNKVIKIDSTMGCNGALFALAAPQDTIAGFGIKCQM